MTEAGNEVLCCRCKRFVPLDDAADMREALGFEFVSPWVCSTCLVVMREKAENRLH